MAKLTKQQAKRHQEACDLLSKDVLTEDEKFFVIENWQESASHINTVAGAFFTPYELARDFAIETFPGRVIDLCAGIGILSFAASKMHRWGQTPTSFTCVEINPDYVAVGKKLLPEATWIRQPTRCSYAGARSRGISTGFITLSRKYSLAKVHIQTFGAGE